MRPGGYKTNTRHNERRAEGECREVRQGGGSDYERGHRTVDREELSSRKRNEWKEEWSGKENTGTRGVKEDRERRRKGRKFRLRGDGKRSKEPKSTEATPKQTEENDSPKVSADTQVEVERICATSGNHGRADVENPDYRGRQGEEDVEKTQDVLGCPQATSRGGSRSGLAKSGHHGATRPHAE